MVKITGVCHIQKDAEEWANEVVKSYPNEYTGYVIRNRTVIHTKEDWHE